MFSGLSSTMRTHFPVVAGFPGGSLHAGRGFSMPGPSVELTLASRYCCNADFGNFSLPLPDGSFEDRINYRLPSTGREIIILFLISVHLKYRAFIGRQARSETIAVLRDNRQRALRNQRRRPRS